MEHPSKRALSKVLVALSMFTWLLASAGLCMAQIDTGSVAGTVKDPSGAVVARVHLTLTNQATGVVQETHSLSPGTYLFADVKKKGLRQPS
jgi:sporulation-control protein spo0M